MKHVTLLYIIIVILIITGVSSTLYVYNNPSKNKCVEHGLDSLIDEGKDMIQSGLSVLRG